MSSYNYSAFSPQQYDLQSADGPHVGQTAPDFMLQTPAGQPRRLLDFDAPCLVLELGSVTCPLFLSRQAGMAAIAHDYPQVSSAVLYIREAHPGAAIPAHTTLADKKACADRLLSEYDDPRTILVDGLDGLAHQAYGSMPNAIYIIDADHIVRFKAPWNNPTATRKALDAVLAGQAANLKSYFAPANPKVALHTLRQAGPGAASDFFKGLPKLIWTVLIRNNLRTFFR